MAKAKTESLCVGDQVRIIRSNGSVGDTVYKIVELNRFACMIREINFVNPNIKYRPHRYDTSLLKRVMPFT